MIQRYRFRIYPTKAQEVLIQKTFGCCRFIWNHYLSLRKQMYEKEQKNMNFLICAKNLTQLKNTYEWLREVDSSALQGALVNLERAFANFFRRAKRGEKPGFPSFKSKRAHKQTYTCKSGPCIKLFGNNFVQIPKLGLVKCRISKLIEGRILSGTVIKSSSGKYFFTICFSDVNVDALPQTGVAIGFKFGTDYFGISSDGTKYENPHFSEKSKKKIARLHHVLSRKTMGSARYEKARIKYARLHEHITNQRNDMLHKLSTELVRENDIICIEDINPLEKMRNRNIAKYLADASFGEFVRRIEYKAQWYGKKTALIKNIDQCDELTCVHVEDAKRILRKGLSLLA